MMVVYANGSIEIDGENIGLYVTQRQEGTVVYIPERKIPCQSVVKGELVTLRPREYKEIKMPHRRYSLSQDDPTPNGVPGTAQLEADIRALLPTLESEIWPIAKEKKA